jgi:hypothetical protein
MKRNMHEKMRLLGRIWRRWRIILKWI